MVWLAAAQRRPWARLDKWREVAVGHAEENGLLLHLLEREHRRVKNGTSEEGRLLLRHPHRRRPSHGDAKEEDGQGVQSRVLLAQLGQAVEALVGEVVEPIEEAAQPLVALRAAVRLVIERRNREASCHQPARHRVFKNCVRAARLRSEHPFKIRPRRIAVAEPDDAACSPTLRREAVRSQLQALRVEEGALLVLDRVGEGRVGHIRE